MIVFHMLTKSLLLVSFLVAFRLIATSDLVKAQNNAEEQAKRLIVMVSGTLNDGPTFGAGIIVGYAANRLYIATASHVVREGLAKAEEITVSFSSLPGETFTATLAQNEFEALDLAVLIVPNIEQLGLSIEAVSTERLGSSENLTRRAVMNTVGQDNGNSWFSPVTPIYYASQQNDILSVESSVNNRGASGGGLFTENWQLVGMVVSHDAPTIQAISLERIVAELKAKNFPVNLIIPPTATTSITQPEEASGQTATTPQTEASQEEATLATGATFQNVIGKLLTKDADDVYSVAFSPDGKILASGGKNTKIVLWDVESWSPVAELPGHSASVRSVAFSLDGKTLASGSNDTTIILWDVESRSPIGEPLQGENVFVTSVAFSPDGKMLASGSQSWPIILWDVESRSRTNLQGNRSLVLSVAFSPDGKTLASGSDSDTILLWDVASRNIIGELQGHSGAVESVAFSPDSKTLASGSDDGTIILWDMTSRTQLGVLQGHSSVVYSVTFSPDSQTLASGSQDNTIILWDVASRSPIGEPLKGHSSWVFSVAFSPDGKTLASASGDDTIILWDVER